MIKTIECPSCGQLNNVDTEKFALAVCGACKAKFRDSEGFSNYTSEKELAVALETEAPVGEAEQVDYQSWSSKIGDSDKQEQYVKDGFFKKLKKHASKIPFAKDAAAMYFCAIDPETPTTAKAIAFGALAYIVLPFDLIPDIILVLGYTDDAAAFWAAYKAIAVHVKDKHRTQAEEWFKN
ncbi:YkvA family protein [Paenibacillus silvisoli]|uniref:YkvA family protein n=1 Tax=Paenibacillus silvisoli TaxID=3110539 RepID=UPI0028039D19|nr:YkvA family protein [Paenibacillus silvisoli]